MTGECRSQANADFGLIRQDLSGRVINQVSYNLARSEIIKEVVE